MDNKEYLVARIEAIDGAIDLLNQLRRETMKRLEKLEDERVTIA